LYLAFSVANFFFPPNSSFTLTASNAVPM